VQLQLTERAAKAALDRARQADVQGWLLRVAVVAGGCNGLTYELFFVPEPGPEDAVVEAEGLRVAVDRASQKLLDGAVIDLPASSQAFAFHNPLARKTCRCGASFEV
jgi:iron-sulfur cluster assembly accessory protein